MHLGAVSIQTQGCKLNQADSQELARRFSLAGYKVVGPADPADITVVNSCTVTREADSKARQALRSANRKSSTTLVVATGCYAQRAPEELARVPGVGIVAGNTEKDRLVEMVLAARGDSMVPRAVGEETPNLPTANAIGRTRAMLKIQKGCNQVCAYCIVPKVRGRERSVPPETLLGQLRQRIREGHKEVVLTGTQLGSYGFDVPGADLTGLIRLLLTEPELTRLRVSSLQPQEITSELLELWADKRLCPHFHMPLQSGSDSMLQRMRRRYTSTDYAEAAARVRAAASGAAITADVIIGFPGETDEEFGDSLSFAAGMEFASMHVFPYSVRPGTSAAYMGPPVPDQTKAERMKAMLALADQQASAFRRRAIGSMRSVLWERKDLRDGKVVSTGLTDNYLRVYTEQGAPLNEVTSALLLKEVGQGLLVGNLQPPMWNES